MKKQMDKEEDRAKRTSRLINVWIYLCQNPHGVTARQIADRFKVTVRTAYRDLEALERENKVPVGEDGAKRFIVAGHHLPPIKFSVAEAMAIFLASRLMLNYSRKYDPNIASTFLKLNSVVKPPLSDQIQKTMDWMVKQPVDNAYIRNMDTLVEAWVNRRTVKISYQALEDAKPTQRLIDPYFIEPAAEGHSAYVIAHCHRHNQIRTFKIERIVTAEATTDTYQVPDDFDANAYLASSWGIVAGGEAETIRLRFHPEVARLMQETVWHPSQVSKPQADGYVIVTFTVASSVELFAWIMGWGDMVEVLEPAKLRKRVLAAARSMVNIYSTG